MLFSFVNSIFYSNSYWIFLLIYIDFIVFLFFNSYIVNVSICGFSICQCYYRLNIIEQNNYTVAFCFLCVTDLYSSIFMYCNVNFTIFTVVFFTYIVFNFMVWVICLYCIYRWFIVNLCNLRNFVFIKYIYDYSSCIVKFTICNDNLYSIFRFLFIVNRVLDY